MNDRTNLDINWSLGTPKDSPRVAEKKAGLEATAIQKMAIFGKEALRALIEQVELVPVSAEESETGKPRLAIHLHGALASLLRLACGLPVHEVVGAAAQM